MARAWSNAGLGGTRKFSVDVTLTPRDGGSYIACAIVKKPGSNFHRIHLNTAICATSPKAPRRAAGEALRMLGQSLKKRTSAFKGLSRRRRR